MRRRKSKYTWLPVIPTTVGAELPGASWFNSTAQVNLNEIGPVFSQALNIVPDDTISADEDTGETTLRDLVEGQEYVVERIVGRVWGGLQQQSASESWQAAIFGIGIAVMPYEDNDTIALNNDSIDPLGASNADGSWMYRNIWTIWNNTNSASGVLGPTNIANSGPDYGFVDTRSVRRVHRNERLTIVMSAHVMSVISGGFDTTELQWGYDLRVLGQMRRARGQSTYT